MSDIPISSIVDVNISISDKAALTPGFGVINIVTQQLNTQAYPTVLDYYERYRLYNSIDDIGSDWGADSEVYKQANYFYSASPPPKTVMVSVRANTATPAELVGGGITDPLSAFVAITNGKFHIVIDGDAGDVTSLNFSTASTFTDVANIVQTQLRTVAHPGFVTAVCKYENGVFKIYSATTGTSSTISFATAGSAGGADVSVLLKLTQDYANTENGLAAESITEALNVIANKFSGFYGLAFTKEVRESVVINGGDPAVIQAAKWTEAQEKVYFTTTNNTGTSDTAVTSDIATLLKNAQYQRTFCNYAIVMSEYPDSFAFGLGATSNFDIPNGIKILNLRQAGGIGYQNLTASEADTVLGKNCNLVIRIAGVNRYRNGISSGGRWFDIQQGADALTAYIRTNVYNAMTQAVDAGAGIPFSDKGIGVLLAVLKKTLDQFAVNGFLSPGYTVEGEYLEKGYKATAVPKQLVSAGNVAARHYDGLAFTGLMSGQIQSVQINGLLVE